MREKARASRERVMEGGREEGRPNFTSCSSFSTFRDVESLSRVVTSSRICSGCAITMSKGLLGSGPLEAFPFFFFGIIEGEKRAVEQLRRRLQNSTPQILSFAFFQPHDEQVERRDAQIERR